MIWTVCSLAYAKMYEICQNLYLLIVTYLKLHFYCATIAYHVELNAISDGRGIWPMSKKNRCIILALCLQH